MSTWDRFQTQWFHVFDIVDQWFEYGNFRVADEVLARLLDLFNRECEEKGTYRDREGRPLTMQMRFVRNFHDLRDVLKLELDLVGFEESYQLLRPEQKTKIIEQMANGLFKRSKQMKTTSMVSSDDCEMDDVTVEEKGISLSYEILHAGHVDEQFRVLGYSFPPFERHDFRMVADEAKLVAQKWADENEVHKAMSDH